MSADPMGIKPGGDVAKLPRWARMYIFALEQQNDRLRAAWATMEDANARVSWSDGLSAERGIPERATVTFLMGSKHHVCVAMRRGKVNVNASGALRIYPSAANDIYLDVE